MGSLEDAKRLIAIANGSVTDDDCTDEESKELYSSAVRILNEVLTEQDMLLSDEEKRQIEVAPPCSLAESIELHRFRLPRPRSQKITNGHDQTTTAKACSSACCMRR